MTVKLHSIDFYIARSLKVTVTTLHLPKETLKLNLALELSCLIEAVQSDPSQLVPEVSRIQEMSQLINFIWQLLSVEFANTRGTCLGTFAETAPIAGTLPTANAGLNTQIILQGMGQRKLLRRKRTRRGFPIA